MSKRRVIQRTDADVARALVLLEANNGNIRQTAAKIGISPSTLRGWRDKTYRQDADAKVAEVREDMAGALEILACKFILGITPEKIADTKARDSLVCAAVAIDKMRLLREQPPPATEAEQSIAESMRSAAEAMVAMAKAAGRQLSIEQATATMRSIQLKESELASPKVQ